VSLFFFDLTFTTHVIFLFISSSSTVYFVEKRQVIQLENRAIFFKILLLKTFCYLSINPMGIYDADDMGTGHYQ